MKTTQEVEWDDELLNATQAVEKELNLSGLGMSDPLTSSTPHYAADDHDVFLPLSQKSARYEPTVSDVSENKQGDHEPVQHVDYVYIFVKFLVKNLNPLFCDKMYKKKTTYKINNVKFGQFIQVVGF